VAVHGSLAATGGGDNLIRLHDFTRGKTITPAADPAAPVAEMATRGNVLLARLATDELRLYDRRTGRPLATQLPGRARAAVLRPDARGAILIDQKGKIAMADLKTGKKTTADDVNPQSALALSADGKVLVAVAAGGVVTVRDVRDGKQQREVALREQGGKVALTPDGSLGGLFGPLPGIVLFDVRTGRGLWMLSGHRGGTLAAAFSPDGRVLASGGRDRMLRFWDVTTRLERRSPQAQADWVCAVAFTPDGKVLASATTAGLIQLWSASGKLLAEREGHRGPVTGLSFPDRKTMVSSGQDGSILVWDVSRVEVEGLPPLMLTGAERDRLWRTMAETDPVAGSLALRKLARDAKGAVALIRAGVKPVDGKRIARWIKELDADEYKVRKQAFDELVRAGRAAEPLLRKALARKPGLEPQRRIEELLLKMQGEVPSGAHLQALRAVEVLEMVGTPEARKVLGELAKGAPEAELTRQAKAALDRLGR
jgi:hypothetical protein